MNITRVFDLLDHLMTYAPKSDLLNAKVNKQWVHHSVQDVKTNAAHLAAGLLHVGLQKGDIVAIISPNRPEWNIVDLACQQIGVVTAPIYPTINDQELSYILNHCAAKAIFIADKNIAQKLATLQLILEGFKGVFAFETIPGTQHWSTLLALGQEQPRTEELEALKQQIHAHELYTLLYTSGTTGVPKGVMLSHFNMLSNVIACKDIAPFTPQWKALSFLPLNHVYERFINTLYLYHGVSIYYAESFETIGENCREIKPQIFVAVPRVLERVLERITDAGAALGGIKKRIFDWSLRIAEQYELNGANGFWYECQRKLLDRLVYQKWRAAVGGALEVVVSGGAALNPRIERIFTCAKIPLLQGYGLTETCVVVAVNRWQETDRCFGTVGVVVENMTVAIAEEDGEILVKGPSVMLGYYKNPEATAEVIDVDQWLHTGDVGTLVDGRFLKLTDRKKEIFKNSAGKYIAPAMIENKLKESKYIEQCMVIGEGQKFASALIVCAVPKIKEYLEKQGLEWPRDHQLSQNEWVCKLIQSEVQKVNTALAPFEQLKRCRIVDQPWTVESGEITPKLSLRRKVILANNQELINQIFRL